MTYSTCFDRKFWPSDGGFSANDMAPGRPPKSFGVSSLVICCWLRVRCSHGFSTANAMPRFTGFGRSRPGATTANIVSISGTLLAISSTART